MADFAVYWKHFCHEGGNGWPATGWYTSRGWFVSRLHRGDRIWLFIGGDACGDAEGPHKGYLAQLLTVKEWRDNPAYDPDCDPGSYDCARFKILGLASRCMLVDPPLLVDDIFRKPRKDARQHIGIARQTPFELADGQVAKLLALLRKHQPRVYAGAGPQRARDQ